MMTGHVAPCLRTRPVVSGSVDNLSTAATRLKDGRCHQSRGEYRSALGCFEDALRIRLSVLGEGALKVANTRHCVGVALVEMLSRTDRPGGGGSAFSALPPNARDSNSDDGDIERAIEHLTAALCVRRRKLGRGHVDTADTAHYLGVALAWAGRTEESLEALHSALEVRSVVFGSEHVTVAETLESLGEAYLQAQDFEHAIQALSYALQVRIAAHGEEGEEVAAAHAVLARAYLKAGDWEAAVEHMVYNMAVLKRIHGPDDPRVAMGYIELGLCYQQGNELDLADASISEAIEMLSSSDIDESNQTRLRAAYVALAAVRWDMQEYELALLALYVLGGEDQGRPNPNHGTGLGLGTGDHTHAPVGHLLNAFPHIGYIHHGGMIIDHTAEENTGGGIQGGGNMAEDIRRGGGGRPGTDEATIRLARGTGNGGTGERSAGVNVMAPGWMQRNLRQGGTQGDGEREQEATTVRWEGGTDNGGTREGSTGSTASTTLELEQRKIISLLLNPSNGMGLAEAWLGLLMLSGCCLFPGGYADGTSGRVNNRGGRRIPNHAVHADGPLGGSPGALGTGSVWHSIDLLLALARQTVQMVLEGEAKRLGRRQSTPLERLLGTLSSVLVDVLGGHEGLGSSQLGSAANMNFPGSLLVSDPGGVQSRPRSGSDGIGPLSKRKETKQRDTGGDKPHNSKLNGEEQKQAKETKTTCNKAIWDRFVGASAHPSVASSQSRRSGPAGGTELDKELGNYQQAINLYQQATKIEMVHPPVICAGHSIGGNIAQVAMPTGEVSKCNDGRRSNQSHQPFENIWLGPVQGCGKSSLCRSLLTMGTRRGSVKTSIGTSSPLCGVGQNDTLDLIDTNQEQTASECGLAFVAVSLFSKDDFLNSPGMLDFNQERDKLKEALQDAIQTKGPEVYVLYETTPFLLNNFGTFQAVPKTRGLSSLCRGDPDVGSLGHQAKKHLAARGRSKTRLEKGFFKSRHKMNDFQSHCEGRNQGAHDQASLQAKNGYKAYEALAGICANIAWEGAGWDQQRNLSGSGPLGDEVDRRYDSSVVGGGFLGRCNTFVPYVA